MTDNDKKGRVDYYVNLANDEFLRKAGYTPSHFADFINEKIVKLIKNELESDDPLPTEMEIKRKLVEEIKPLLEYMKREETIKEEERAKTAIIDDIMKAFHTDFIIRNKVDMKRIRSEESDIINIHIRNYLQSKDLLKNDGSRLWGDPWNFWIDFRSF